ncbi:hypothetical protein RM780_15975 [Streptomyces sp. DSM 44917]|uniref:Lipoprotein n=1 Tax=Streptomyces boetiae TaxID=3075541 RepID=A0ABU2LA53_9ACTN|nr:hypothetical protein [Streptomyces sp. DSM 44917]MDT0308448.1 hypothetical protein [Streptomyces sp. DSM 44917]
MRDSRHPRRLRWLAVPALVLTLALTACGGDGEAGDSDAGGTGGGPASDATLEWYDCMRDNGVDMPDPDPDNPAVVLPQGSADDPDVRAAVEACQDILPNGGPGSGEPLGDDVMAQLREFTRCMRDNGVDMPDPDSSGALSMPEGLDYQGAEFQGAIEECQELAAGLPMRFGPPGGGL